MSLGDTLRRAREARRISLNQAALETRIRQSVLEALEDGGYSALPPRPFLRGLLRNYALYLHLDADTTLDEYEVETGHKPAAPQMRPQEPELPAPASSSNYTAPGDAFPTAPAETPEPFAFPPFQIPTTLKTNGAAEVTRTSPLETVFQVAPEAQVPPPTPPLNLSQEPPTLGQRIGSTRIPEAVSILSLAIALFALVSVGFTAFQNFANPLANLATPRPTTIATATIPPGSTPTGIPTLAQTLAAQTPAPTPILPTVNVTGTVATAPVEPTQISLLTPTLASPPDAQMTLTIEANGEMGAWIIVDEDEVLNGTLKNETRSFTAHARLYMRVTKIGNGRVFFQGTRILPRDQQERRELNRAWLMSPLGTPVIIPPTPYPSPVTPTEFPTATLVPSETPTPSTTPTFTVTATPTASTTTTPTLTQTLTPTLTPTPALTLTLTPTPTSTLTLTPTITQTRTQTVSPTHTRCAPNPGVECE